MQVSPTVTRCRAPRTIAVNRMTRRLWLRLRDGVFHRDGGFRGAGERTAEAAAENHIAFAGICQVRSLERWNHPRPDRVWDRDSGCCSPSTRPGSNPPLRLA